MGLPLYQAPVESDIKGKPAPKTAEARSRSTIRRNRRSRAEVPVPGRPSRRRLLPPAGYNPWDYPNNVPSELREHEPYVAESAARSSDDLQAGPRAGNPMRDFIRADAERAHTLRDMVGQLGMANDRDRTAAVFGTRFAELYAGSNPQPPRDQDSDDSGALPLYRVVPEPDPHAALARRRPTPSALHSRPQSRPSQSPHRLAGAATRDLVGRASRVHARLRALNRHSGFTPNDHPPSYRRSASARQEAPYDGLGDRDRSLSPEGDGVWDTLLSGITPDPQPPSVGSSFASTSASAANSQSTAAGSAGTPLSAPEVAPESPVVVEPPCESACDSSDTDTESEEAIAFQSFPDRAEGRRSYADVARSMSQGNDEDPLESLGGRDTLQRVLRALALRNDLPDEWWAAVGLSRALSREASS